MSKNGYLKVASGTQGQAETGGGVYHMHVPGTP